MYDADDNIGRTMVRRVELVETKDDGDLQLLKVEGFADETFSKVHRVMPHGLASHAPKGSHAMLMSAGGRPDQAVILGSEHQQYRPRDLPEGATRLYDTANSFIYLDAAGNLHAKVDTEATIEAPTVRIKGNLIIEGNITHTGNMTTSGVHTDSNGVHV